MDDSHFGYKQKFFKKALAVIDPLNHSYIYFVVLGAKLEIPTGSNLKPTRRMFPIITVVRNS
jgi:hypothetical protein